MSEIKAKDIRLELVSNLKPNPKNRNNHPEEQIERLCKIIKYQGFRNPLIVSNRTGYIIAGHGRLLAAKKLEIEKVPVLYQDFEDEDQEYAAGVSDNAIASWAELDFSGINTDLPELGPFDLDLLGIKDFVVDMSEKEGLCDSDAVPDVRTTNIVIGDLFQLGSHRLLCGDSTKKEDVERLMNGEKADMVFTDPPYGMRLDAGYEQMKNKGTGSGNFIGTKGNTYRNVIGDHEDFSPSLISTVFDSFGYVKEIFLWGMDYFAELIPGRNDGSPIVWDKRTSESQDEGFGSCFELCWSKQKHKRYIARVLWAGVFGMGASAETDKRVHPTQKPVKLAEWFFERWGKDAKIIIDLYLGSGSTLIACHKTGRRCFSMEIDPHYVDVAIRRWETFSGEKAYRLNNDGSKTPFSEIGQSK